MVNLPGCHLHLLFSFGSITISGHTIASSKYWKGDMQAILGSIASYSNAFDRQELSASLAIERQADTDFSSSWTAS
jgi:hypothetical protein